MNRLSLLLLTLFFACFFPHAVAQGTFANLEKAKKLEPKIPEFMAAAGSAIKALIPNPAAYEASLPPQEKVIQYKDQLNFRNYSGLSEAYLFHGDKAKAEELFHWCMTNSPNILGRNDFFVPGLVAGDFALFYYTKGNHNKAEPLFRQAVDLLETYGPPGVANNLIANYLSLALICNKNGKIQEAEIWAKKLVDLSVKQYGPRDRNANTSP